MSENEIIEYPVFIESIAKGFNEVNDFENNLANRGNDIAANTNSLGNENERNAVELQDQPNINLYEALDIDHNNAKKHDKVYNKYHDKEVIHELEKQKSPNKVINPKTINRGHIIQPGKFMRDQKIHY